MWIFLMKILKTVFFPSLLGHLNILLFSCPMCVYSKWSSWPPVYMLRAATDILWSVNLYLVAIRSLFWCTWLLWCSGVIFSAKSTLVSFGGKPNIYWNHLDKLLLEQRFLIDIKFRSFHISWHESHNTACFIDNVSLSFAQLTHDDWQ